MGLFLLGIAVWYGAAVVSPHGIWGILWGAALFFFFVSLVGRRDAFVAAPLFFAAPLLLVAFPFSLPVRTATVVLFGLLFFWAVIDSIKRKRGAPVVHGRVVFFFLAGIFAIFAVVFANRDVSGIGSGLVLGVVMAISGAAIAIVRSIAQYVRVTAPHPTSVFLDAAAGGFLIAEVFVALSFFPFSPFTLAAALTIVLWAFLEALVAMRLDFLTAGRLIRTLSISAVCLVAVFAFTPWSWRP